MIKPNRRSLHSQRSTRVNDQDADSDEIREASTGESKYNVLRDVERDQENREHRCHDEKDVGRPHLANPAWALLEAAKIGYHDVAWPKQYLSGKQQLERNLERERMLAAAQETPLERFN